MRTVHCSGRLIGESTRGMSAQGDVCPGVCVCPGVSEGVSGRGVSAQGVSSSPHSPVDRILDTRLWKHYFPQLLLRTVITIIL